MISLIICVIKSPTKPIGPVTEITAAAARAWLSIFSSPFFYIYFKL